MQVNELYLYLKDQRSFIEQNLKHIPSWNYRYYLIDRYTRLVQRISSIYYYFWETVEQEIEESLKNNKSADL